MSQSKIYVGNLPFSTSSDELQDMFGEFGSITQLNVIKDHATGRSKGFAFITFETAAAAEKSVADMNGKKLGDRDLKVSIARENTGTGGGGGGSRPPRTGGGYGDRNGGGGGYGRDDRGGDRGGRR